MVDWKQLVRARLEELGMAQMDTTNAISRIEQEVGAALRSNKDVPRKKKAEATTAPLLTALGKAMQGNRAIRRYLGDGNQVDGFVNNLLMDVEERIAVDSGERWCDQCINWHPSTPHNPVAL